MWVLYAFGSAFFAGITSILAKCGIKKTDSNVATAIRTIVVLIFSWIMVFVVKAQGQIAAVSAKTWIFLVLSGVATGASWLCYFKALQLGDVNRVVPIDKSSTILTIILAFIFFKEEINVLRLVCVVLIAIGTYMMITKKEISQEEQNKAMGSHGWLFYAVLSAVFASFTSILGKVGIEGINSNLDSGAYHGLDSGICHRKTAHHKAYREKGAWLYLPFGTCNRRLMALLLQGTAGRTCECRSAYR